MSATATHSFVLDHAAAEPAAAERHFLAKLAALGFRVKEMIGGIGYWRKEGLPVEGASPHDAPLYA